MVMNVYSGDVCEGPVGNETNFVDIRGAKLFTGDIVIVSHNQHTLEELAPHCLSVVVNGKSEDDGPFIMGIKIASQSNDPDWKFLRIKCFSDVVHGEHWKAFGFNFRESQ